MLLVIALLLAAETPKVDPPKPRTAQLPELAAVKIERNEAQAELLKRRFMEIQGDSQRVIDEACKSAGFSKCQTDGKILTEVLEVKK